MSLELDNSQEYNHNNSSRSKSKFQKKEHKWKELLYNLFYEIKSEILNTKLEIEEDEYQENINSTTIPQLVNYIHDSIQILLKKKIEDSKEEQKELDKKYYLSGNSSNGVANTKQINCDDKNFLEYESIIKNLESKQRILTKNIFQQKLQIDAMENKIEEYMEMEDEFEEMKTKLKYEDGRFLNNDRKDNEILIIRGENSILKNEINKLEEKVKSLEEVVNTKEKKIEEINKELEQLKNKFDEKQNEANTAPSININISNVHSNSNINNNNNEINNMNNMNNMNNNETDGGNMMKKSIYNSNRNSSNFITNSKFFYNYVNEQISINNKKNTFSSKKKKEKAEKMIHKNYYRNKTSKDKKLLSQKIKTKLLNNKNNICDLLSTTRNESLDRAKQDLLNKYLIGIKGKNMMNLNNSCMKVNSLTGKIYYKKNGNNNMNNIQIQNNKKNPNEFNTNRSKSNSNKTKPPSASQSHNNVISYRSVS